MDDARSTRQCLDDHLGQAEFSLKVSRHFACLAGTPAEASIVAALARVQEARRWVSEGMTIRSAVEPRAEVASLSARERRQIVNRRLARLAP